MQTASNVNKSKATKEPTEKIAAAATKTTTHESKWPGSHDNMSHMSAKSVVKIATLSHATSLEENHAVLTTFRMGKHSAKFPKIVFGVVSLNLPQRIYIFSFVSF